MKPKDILDQVNFHNSFKLKGGPLHIVKGPFIPLLISFFVAFLATVIVQQYLNIDLWRHDSFKHTPLQSWYDGNLKQEGRWINYLLFDVIKSIPARVSSLLGLAAISLFTFLITEGVLKDIYLRVITSLSVLALPMLHSQMMWPNISFFPIAALLLFYFLSKKIPSILIFALSAIFYFGTLSNFYFLIPLIFLKDVNTNLVGNIKTDLLYVLKKVILPFAGCFIIGYLAANGIVNLMTGQSIEMGEWRNPSPATDLNQLLSNLSGIHDRMGLFFTKVFSEAHIALWLGLGILTLLSLTKKSIWILLILIMVFLSAFYTTAYHGIFISDRTLSTSIIPLILIFFILPGIKFNNNMLHLFLCTLFIWPFFNRSTEQLNLFGKIQGYYNSHIVKAVKDIPKGVMANPIVFISDKEVLEVNQQIKTHLNAEFKYCEFLGKVGRTVVIALRAQGYDNVYIAPDEMITELKKQVPANENIFSVVTLSNQPNSFGVVMNTTTLDISSLEQL